MDRVHATLNRTKQAIIKRVNFLKEESVLSYLLAIFPRILFLAHAIFAVRLLRNLTRSTSGNNTVTTAPLYIGIMLLCVESLYTIVARRGHENKHLWFSGFLYLTTQVPTIWLMEFNFLQRRLDSRNPAPTNATETGSAISTTSDSLKYWYCITDTGVCGVQFVKNFAELGLIAVIIIGRWMLPRGDLTRDQLSALLISYINVAADLTEFIGFHSKLPGMLYSWEVAITILSVYSVSLLQFIIVTTSTTYEYNEQEKSTIERITNTPHNRNLPSYLRPHARKLRRSSISRNIDKIAVQSFAKGQRSSARRTAILSDSPGKKQSSMGNRKRATKSQAVRIKIGTGIDDRTGNYKMRRTQVHSGLDKYRINMNRNMELIEEEEEPVEISRSQRNAKALDKWASDAKIARRIQRFRRVVVEENWRELADALVEMKSSPNKKHNKEMKLIDERLNGLLRPVKEEIEESRWKKLVEIAQSDIGAILIALFFQECPFFVTRIVVMYQFQVINRGLVFYTIKNMFMLTFLSYKLWVTVIE